ncbi:MAG: hypothetical protein QOG62_1472 [Thermoleophilaceae bacterium]|jgi:signal transduction histidine kinase|nr:hypothetical protein [Thermoleophilaceae bacterium]
MTRLPIRLRLTAGFALAVVVVFLAIGAFTLSRVEADLTGTIDRGLQSRGQDLASLLQENDGRLGEGRKILAVRDGSFVQILGPTGDVVKSSRDVTRVPLFDVPALEALGRSGRAAETEDPRQPGTRVRELVTPVGAEGRRYWVIVGAVVTERDRALDALRNALALAGLIGLVAASLVGYLLAAAALRPVEAMRRQAASVTEMHPERRLPLPRADDELRLLAETLNAMLDRLDTALARERDFVADASHELRTPLATLKAEVELALDSGGSREDLVEALVSANTDVDRLSQLAEDLLVIARSDRGQLPVRAETVDLRLLLENLRKRFERRLADAGRPMEIDVAPGLAGWLDPLRVEQALGNLIDNAIRHGAGQIRASAIPVDGWVELSVSDAGEGFPEATRKVAFERFTRGDQARGRGGAGLGLAIVEAIAVAHGGTARIAGSTVTLRLPSAPAVS